ncbi:MAG: Asp-tRNA(Asn)/Glu-tRNA(Gln) amidotransferase subunit GatA [Patescibacteria group bacterium]|nr:MAG: Asp-tRNA(Asn)/Glu-tRNA(Gln) amidotransferase subunit GatA [Patescibacteria group bacterium]
MNKLYALTIAEASKGLRAKSFTSLELTGACLERLRAVESQVHATLQVLDAQALQDAKASDRRLAAGEALGPLDGVPVMVKDNMQLLGSRTTAASKILENYESPFDATAVAKLKAAGAVILAKTNLDEFAMGSSTETSAYGVTRNPWNLTKIPGGSSGGSAAALASGMCLGALGSDTGGSIRQPAAMCGVTGFKPTYGRVSRYGLLSMASSLDQIGTFGRTAEDAKLLLEAIEGKDPLDSTSAETSRYVPRKREGDGLKGLRVGLPEEFFSEGMDPEVRERVMTAAKELEKLGAELVDVKFPSAKYGLPVYYVIMPCEVSANLSRYDGMRYGLSVPTPSLKETYFASRGEGFGKEVRRRIMLGAHALSSGWYDAYYLQAQKVRAKMKAEFDALMQDVDLLLSPTAPSVAWDLGEKFEDPIAMYLTDIYTVTVNVVGAPAVSVPCGFVRDMPVGLQLIGRQFEDALVLDAASRYQEVTDWHAKQPML